AVRPESAGTPQHSTRNVRADSIAPEPVSRSGESAHDPPHRKECNPKKDHCHQRYHAKDRIGPPVITWATKYFYLHDAVRRWKQLRCPQPLHGLPDVVRERSVLLRPVHLLDVGVREAPL